MTMETKDISHEKNVSGEMTMEMKDIFGVNFWRPLEQLKYLAGIAFKSLMLLQSLGVIFALVLSISSKAEIK